MSVVVVNFDFVVVIIISIVVASVMVAIFDVTSVMVAIVVDIVDALISTTFVS